MKSRYGDCLLAECIFDFKRFSSNKLGYETFLTSFTSKLIHCPEPTSCSATNTFFTDSGTLLRNRSSVAFMPTLSSSCNTLNTQKTLTFSSSCNTQTHRRPLRLSKLLRLSNPYDCQTLTIVKPLRLSNNLFQTVHCKLAFSRRHLFPVITL